jgi:hypothetical protein
MDKQPLKPSRWYYGLAVLVFVVGAVFFVRILYKNLSSLTDTLIQVIVPGEKEITLSDVGKYTIFYEYQSVVDGKIYVTGDLAGLQCALTSKETGANIELSRPTMSSTYAVGGRAGKSVLAFSIDQPGNYRFSAWYSEGQKGQEIVLAIGSGFTKKLTGTIFNGIAIFFGTIAISSAIVVITAIKREKAKKQIEGKRI